MSNYLTESEPSAQTAYANADAISIANQRNAAQAPYEIQNSQNQALAGQLANQNTQDAQAQAKRADDQAQSQAVLRAVSGRIANGEDPGQVFDSYTPLLPALGVDPDHVAPLRQALVADPSGTLAKLGQALTAPKPADIQGQPVQTVDPSTGKRAMGYVRKDGTFAPVALPDGQQIAEEGVGSPQVVQKADGTYDITRVPKYGTNALVTPIDGTPVNAAATQTRVGIAQDKAAAASAVGSDLTGDTAAKGLAALIPGVRITGTGRTAQRNAQVGGAPNSAHLSNKAVDFVAPPGVSPDAIKAQLIKAGYPVSHFISEPAIGDQGAHIHWDFGPAPTTQMRNAAAGVTGTQLSAQVKASGAGAGAGGGLSPAAVKLIAQQAILNGGKFPTGMSRNPVMQAQILNEYANQAQARGLGPQALQANQQLAGLRAKLVSGLGQSTPNSPGGKVQSANALTAHADAVEGLANALHSGNVQLINQARQAYQTAFGEPAPSNLALAGKALGDETARFVVGSTAAFDRKAYDNAFKGSSSPAQISGAVNTIRGLAAGRLSALRQGYVAAGADKEFDGALTPNARRLVTPATAPAQASPGQRGPRPPPNAPVDQLLKYYGN